MENIPNEFLRCPITKENLRFEDNFAYSSKARYKYNSKLNYWSFINDVEVLYKSDLWNDWKLLQENGIISYNEDPIANIAEGWIEEYVDFGNFCQFKGLILDVGVGPQKSPSHFTYSTKSKDAVFFGLDPLIGLQPRNFIFIHGIGENMPLQDNLFDQVLFVTSLDHFINPFDALCEAKRVIKPAGEICIFHGYKSINAPKLKKSNNWYDNLKIPATAQDPFHFKRFDISEIEKMVKQINLNIKEVKKRIISEFKTEYFIKISE